MTDQLAEARIQEAINQTDYIWDDLDEIGQGIVSDLIIIARAHLSCSNITDEQVEAAADTLSAELNGRRGLRRDQVGIDSDIWDQMVLEIASAMLEAAARVKGTGQ